MLSARLALLILWVLIQNSSAHPAVPMPPVTDPSGTDWAWLGAAIMVGLGILGLLIFTHYLLQKYQGEQTIEVYTTVFDDCRGNQYGQERTPLLEKSLATGETIKCRASIHYQQPGFWSYFSRNHQRVFRLKTQQKYLWCLSAGSWGHCYDKGSHQREKNDEASQWQVVAEEVDPDRNERNTVRG